ncbi:uncharacterized protein LAJ45_05438 [Morchella importuna]|uniref:Ubiquitin 3 binding protein But2 C-terminal domain-containing protein n=1 Tax=Morchella conica CCBAS932 TaxID=1392247 RepID=A0A3N4K916_9PEZI|nr:uncharacterized protein LAJ45_05438 [Morchella importuna]KAH8150742.1 hypothetical protein LAJ45_05438 [Morchella importuna]RPB07017.1 hypothetical protein P167DRAFT_540439 [Morchella conica CCBAS932]
MKTAIFTSVLCLFSSLVSSVAIPSAEAAAIETRSIATISPSLSVPIYQDSPDYAGGAQSYAFVSRYNGAHDINTLISYYFPDGYAGKKCSFSFSAVQGLDGSKKVQLFTVGGRDITPNDTFNYRPHRDAWLGIFNAGTGVFDGAIPTFACPTSATTLNYEVVPQNDNDYVWWYIWAGGLVINVE